MGCMEVPPRSVPEHVSSPLRIGFLASHNATDARAIVDAIHHGQLNALPVVMISNNSSATALEYARSLSPIPFNAIHMSEKSDRRQKTPDEVDQLIAKTLKEHEVDLVLCVGYMKKIGPKTLEAFEGRIFNVHPSLLPDFPGLWGDSVHQAVIQRRLTSPEDKKTQATGATIHHVTTEYDEGEIALQAAIMPPISPDDTLSSIKERVQTLEKVLFIQLVDEIANGIRTVPQRRS